jgi:hypothetical protein
MKIQLEHYCNVAKIEIVPLVLCSLGKRGRKIQGGRRRGED